MLSGDMRAVFKYLKGYNKKSVNSYSFFLKRAGHIGYIEILGLEYSKEELN